MAADAACTRSGAVRWPQHLRVVRGRSLQRRQRVDKLHAVRQVAPRCPAPRVLTTAPRTQRLLSGGCGAERLRRLQHGPVQHQRGALALHIVRSRYLLLPVIRLRAHLRVAGRQVPGQQRQHRLRVVPRGTVPGPQRTEPVPGLSGWPLHQRRRAEPVSALRAGDVRQQHGTQSVPGLLLGQRATPAGSGQLHVLCAGSFHRRAEADGVPGVQSW